MKESQIKNLSTIPAMSNEWGEGNRFTVKPISDEGLLNKCAASFVELEPGNEAYAYHYHEINEEIFVVLNGEGIVRTSKGEVKIKAGDAISFPAGEGGAHVVKNTSDKMLVYVDFSTRSEAEISHRPEAGMMMVMSGQNSYVFNEPEKQ